MSAEALESAYFSRCPLNSHDVIHAVIGSIADQSFRSIEVIISDGGSSDQTVSYAMAQLQNAAIEASAIISPGSSIYHRLISV